MFTSIGKTISNTGIVTDFPITPTFQLENIADTGYPELTTSFYLLNTSSNDLEKNFAFLQAFFAGTQWYQLPMGVIEGTNVYNVLVPGRFNILWASARCDNNYCWKIKKKSINCRKME